MATTITRVSYIALRHTSRIPVRRKCLPSTPHTRQFHISPLSRAKDDLDDDLPKQNRKSKHQPFKFSLSNLDPEQRKTYKSLSPQEQQQWQDEAKQMHEYMTSPDVESQLSGAVSQAVSETQEESPHVDIVIPRVKPGFFNLGEEEEQDSGEDEEFEGDDISSLGHAGLEQHREMRQYARIMAWEMPLLSKLAKPFEPPSSSEPLRFRYTTYMGETHPASKKIVLEFCTRDLPHLTEPQRIKLIKLVGPRYNPSNDIVKMSSEMFETQAQNKRYLGDLVDTLIAEAQDESDTFEDVPLDFRHHKEKKKVEFPEEWKMGEGRMEMIEGERERRTLEEGKRVEEGRIVVGTAIIEEALKRLPSRDEQRLLLESQRGGKGKGRGRLLKR